jgi:hypothetical protein
MNPNLADIGTLTMNGTIRIIASGLKAGSTIQLWTADKMSGKPQFDLPAGYEWDTSRISEGLLIVKGIDTTTGIGDAARLNDNVQTTNDKPRYNLSGQRVGQDYKGIIIVGGKKIVKN